MEDVQKTIDLASVLNSPSYYSETEVRQMFADEACREEYIAAIRTRQAARRAMTEVPDVEQQWQEFCASNISEEPASASSSRLRYLWSALAGAAAMLLAVFVFNHFSAKSNGTSDMIAMEYDDNPQNIVMKRAGKATIIKQDSVSFLAANNVANVGKSQTAKVEDVKGRTLSTPRGMDLKVMLPDGSEIWLNAESSLSFPESFDKERRVNLSGEAYFKIARDTKRPFTVTTERMNVKVLGTEFNFRSYSTERPQVSLVKGSVEVLSNKGAVEAILSPGQGANIDKEGALHVNDVDIYAAVQWKDGFFYFQNQTLLTTLQEIARWYNVGVIFKDAAMANEKIHFSALRQESLSQTIEKLNMVLDTDIIVEGKNIVVR